MFPMSGLAEFLSDRDGSDGFRRRRRFLWLPCEDDTQAIAPFRSVEERPSDCLRARGQTRKWSIEWNGIETKQKKRKEKGKKKRNRRRWHCETLSRVVPCSYHLVGSRARLIKVGANWHRRPFGRLKRIAARFRRSITHTQRQLRWRKFAVSFGSSFGRSCWLGLVLFLVFVRCEPVRM